MTKYVIQAIEFASGEPCPHAGQWLTRYDPDAYDGVGYADFTLSLKNARRFDSPADAMAFWNQQSTVRPLRLDGKPNKPLTALTITIDSIPDVDDIIG